MICHIFLSISSVGVESVCFIFTLSPSPPNSFLACVVVFLLKDRGADSEAVHRGVAALAVSHSPSPRTSPKTRHQLLRDLQVFHGRRAAEDGDMRGKGGGGRQRVVLVGRTNTSP